MRYMAAKAAQECRQAGPAAHGDNTQGGHTRFRLQFQRCGLQQTNLPKIRDVAKGKRVPLKCAGGAKVQQNALPAPAIISKRRTTARTAAPGLAARSIRYGTSGYRSSVNRGSSNMFWKSLSVRACRRLRGFNSIARARFARHSCGLPVMLSSTERP